MNYLSTDHLIVYAFLLITLGIGLWAGRGIKDIREYAIANKMYGTGVLTMTFLATYIGGSTVIGELANIFTDGIIMSVVATTQVICILFMALFIAPRMVYFEGCLTMGDMMATLYGKYGQVITGILGFISAICIVSAQILALGYVYESLLGLKSHWAVGLGGLIAVVYAAQGGIKAVTITDVFQFIVLVIFIPLIANIVVHEVGGVKELFLRVPTAKLSILSHEKFSYYATITLFICVFNSYLLSPPYMARLLMARDKKQAADMLFIGAAFDPLFKFLILLIGLAAFILYPTLEPSKIMPYLINGFFPVGARGLCIAGILAVVMSTADSFLHAAGLSFTHDIIKPLRPSQAADINELRWTQYCTFGIGCLAIALALGSNDIFTIVVYGLGITGASVTLPFVVGVLGLKTDIQSFLVALLVTLPTFLAANLLLSIELNYLVFPISLLANALVFFTMHVIQNKGFALVQREETHNKEFIWRPTWRGFVQYLPTLNKLLKYSQDKVAKYGASPTSFALFVSFNYLVPFFMHSYATPDAYAWVLGIRSISVLLCVGLMLQPYWPSWLAPYFPSYYHLSLLYCLPFVTTFLFLIERSSIEWLINVTLSILLLVVLADWVTFVILSLLGIFLGIVGYKLLIGASVTPPDSDTLYTLVYACLFSTLIGLLFARRKQQRFDTLFSHNQVLSLNEQENQAHLLETAKEKIRILQALKHGGIKDLLHIARLASLLRLYAALRRQPALFKPATELEALLMPMTLQLRGIEDRAANFLRLTVEQVEIDALLESVQQQLFAKGYQHSIQFHLPTQFKVMFCDPQRLQTLLVRSSTALQESQSSKGPLYLAIEDTKLHYPLPSVGKDYLKKVDAIRITIATQPKLPALQEAYLAQLNGTALTTPETAQELALMENKRIVKAHYGNTEVQEGIWSYVLPVDVSEVRPRDLDKPYMELGATPVRANDQYEGAQEQEKAFLQAVERRSGADLDTVKSVIELIKWYHGPVSRKSGEPFYLHPIAVAHIVLDYNTNEATILGALLHDTVEDTAMLLEDIEAVFGTEAARIVDTVTHLESHKESFYKVKLSAEENIQMLLKADDKRALYVKVADRMHNMRTIDAKPLKSQLKTAKETLEFFVPLCKERLGLLAAAEELEERSLAVIAQEPSS